MRTSDILGDSDLGYGSPRRESDVRKFRRDREILAAQGVFIKEIRLPGARRTEDSLWALDREHTFIAGGLVTPQDAMLLIQAIDDYLATTDTPLAKPLRTIRQKAAEMIGYSYGELPRSTCPSSPTTLGSPCEAALWSAFSLRRSITFDYTNADGEGRAHELAIYGIMAREGVSYVIGLDESSRQIRTFRVDRVRRIRKLGSPYRIPEDFSSMDYVFLPFELGDEPPVPITCSFPLERTQRELDALTYRRGRLERGADAWFWHIGAHDLEDAAAFCLRHARDGMRPVAPERFADAWRARIGRTVEAHVQQ